MLIHRLSKYRNLPLLVLSLQVDPHGEYVCLLTQSKKLLLVEVLALMRYFQIYRLNFKHNLEYSFHEELPWLLQIQPSLKEQQIYGLLVSQRQNSIQHIVFVYLNNVETVTFHYTNRTVLERRIYNLPHQIIHANIVANTIYFAMYNLTTASLNLSTNQLKTEERTKKLSQSTPETKDTLRRKELMRYCEANAEQGQLWQSAGGLLMDGKKIITSEFIEQLDISNSLQELEFRQMKDYAPIKYQMSACRYYIVGGDNILNPPQEGGLFIIRSKSTHWSQICELPSKPQINPYWTFYYKYEREARLEAKSSKGDNKDANRDRLLVATYNDRQKEIIISWIVVDLQKRKKLLGAEGKEQFDKIRYASTIKQIISVKNLKHEVIEVRWIGLAQFMYLERDGQVYYGEFESKYLQY